MRLEGGVITKTVSDSDEAVRKQITTRRCYISFWWMFRIETLYWTTRINAQMKMNDQIFYYWQSSFMRRTFLAVRWQRVNWMKKFLSMSCLIITKCGDYFVVLCSCSVVDVSQEDFDSINIQRRISSRADLNLEISSFLFSIDFEQHAFRI